MVDTVLFDIGGPIYPDENFVHAVVGALDELRAEAGLPPVSRDRFAELYAMQRAAQGGSLRRALAAEFLGDERRYRELHARAGPRWVHPPGTLYPDVLPCLRALRGRVRIGIVANQETAVVDALRRDGVAEYIDVWAVSAQVGVEKPDPAIFQWAMARAGADPSSTVHVGNRLDNDVRPARALGLGTIWVLRGEAPDEPTVEQLAVADLVVKDLTGVAEQVFALPLTAR